MTMTLLVTGGAGYVGSHTASLLLDRGHRVVVVDNLRTGHWRAVPEGAEFVQLDLADKGGLSGVFDRVGFDAVLHFAANSLVGESMEKPWLYLGDNISNATNLIRCAVDHGVGRFVLSSTANIFNTVGDSPIDEDTPIDPPSPYGESKNIIERLLLWADRVHGLRSACLRYFNAAGAHPDGSIGEDHRPETHLIPIVLQTALGKRDKIAIFGDDYETSDGTCIRDYVHVMDLAEAHLLILGTLEGRSCRYNLGTGRGHTVREVIQMVAAVTQRPIPVEIGPRRAGDPAVLVASSERIMRDLGWRPRHDLRSIVQTAWNWHGAHPDGYM